METLATLFALLLPVLLGGLWLNLLVPAATPARSALVWGYGCLTGLVLLPLLMRLLAHLGLGLDFAYTTATALALALVAALAGLARRGAARQAPQTPQWRTLTTAQRALCALLLGLIALRLLNLGLEIIWRPLYPWDATMHWATKARVWFEYGDMVPFVAHDQWLQRGGEGVFTDRHPDYPQTVSLLQVWMNLAGGHWNESLMNLPWLACFAGLGLAFFGQLRLAGAGLPTATAFSYLLLSLPLMNTHVALAGYADLFMGAVYGGSVMALHNWMRLRRNWLLALSLLLAAMCPLVKNEGVIWALTLVPAFTVAFLARRDAAKLVLLGALVVLLLALVLPESTVVAGHPLQRLTPTFNPQALPGLVKSIWLHDNWHLGGYLLLMLVPLGLVMPGAITRSYLGLTAALATAVGAFLFLFLFTGFGWGATNFAAVGRLEMHLAPGLLFLCALLFEDLRRRGRILAAAPPTGL
ncbi:MAG: hypothetical protein CME59_21110 [Halioglobus sp.]|nr:hypothetical protein [Halioglobus sp.]|tara:strand:- start:2959 stop:4365 length:1407 start_codon:yes stop_codon:yes gene_type:complete